MKMSKNSHGGPGRKQGRHPRQVKEERLAIGNRYLELAAQEKREHYRLPILSTRHHITSLDDDIPGTESETDAGKISKARATITSKRCSKILKERKGDLRAITRTPKSKEPPRIFRQPGGWRPSVLAQIRWEFEDKFDCLLSDRTIGRYAAEALKKRTLDKS